MKQNPLIKPGMLVAVVGFGRSGQAMTRYLAACGARLLVSDSRQLADLAYGEKELLRECGAQFEGGGHSEAFLGRAELIVASPGVSLAHPALAALRSAGLPFPGELALAAGLFQAPVVAITGTNGKTTVTELVGELLAAGGKKAFVGGNIGTPIGEYLLAPEGYDVVVLELSSFQLELCGAFVPTVAVLLNLTPDHLDRHGSMEGYAAAKMKIFSGGAAGRAVMNGDDPWCRQFSALAACKSLALFGYDPAYDAWIDGTTIKLTAGGRQSHYDLAGSALASLSGCQNSAAALLAVEPFDLDPAAALQALRAYNPGEHRVQLVTRINGITYINDSKATNTGAVINGLGQVGGSIILIAGGRDKGDDYRLMRAAVSRHVKALVLIGEAAEAIAAALGDLAPVVRATDMDDAVSRAAALARPGDTVLLSPACASFDMFDNYPHRGQCFIKAVAKLESLAATRVAS